MPPSTSPVAEGEAGEAYACTPIQRARRQEGEAFALRLGRTLDRCSRHPRDPSLLATGVPHQVGCGRWRRCISSVSSIQTYVQVFHLNVANRSCMLHMLQAYVSIVSCVSNICFKCFIWILHAYVTMALYACFKCFKTHAARVFIWMLQK